MPSTIAEIKKVKGKAPIVAFAESMISGSRDIEREMVDALRDVTQVRNAFKSVLAAKRLSQDTIYNVMELANETGFVHHVRLVPELEIICYKQSKFFIQLNYYYMIQWNNVKLSKGVIQDFSGLITRDDLECQCLSYDTTFEHGPYFLSILLYRQTEFVEKPIAPLMYLIHERKFESVHTVLFQHAVDIIPGLRNAQNVIIVSDEEKAIVNSITKVMPNIKSFRCWIHAYQNIKEKLQALGIRRKEDVKEYKNDFIRLLTQMSKVEYKSVLADYYLKKSNKVSDN